MRQNGELKLLIKRRISPSSTLLPDPGNATLGTRLRYLRRRLGLTIDQFATKTGVSHNTIGRLERSPNPVLKPWVLGKILPFLASRFKEVFPETGGDPYNFVVPPKSFGAWLKNLRIRKGLKQKELASLLGVNRESIRRYEVGESQPAPAVRGRLRKAFRLNDEMDRFL